MKIRKSQEKIEKKCGIYDTENNFFEKSKEIVEIPTKYMILEKLQNPNELCSLQSSTA